MKFILDKQLISQRDSNMSKRVSKKTNKKNYVKDTVLVWQMEISMM